MRGYITFLCVPGFSLVWMILAKNYFQVISFYAIFLFPKCLCAPWYWGIILFCCIECLHIRNSSKPKKRCLDTNLNNCVAIWITPVLPSFYITYLSFLTNYCYYYYYELTFLLAAYIILPVNLQTHFLNRLVRLKPTTTAYEYRINNIEIKVWMCLTEHVRTFHK